MRTKKSSKLLMEQVRDELWKERSEIDHERMKDKHNDYELKFEQYIEMAKTDPSLGYAIRQTKKPAEYIYNYMTSLEINKDPEKYREQVKAELLAEMKKERTAQAKEAARDTPKTQASARGAQPGAGTVHQKSSLSSILGVTGCNKPSR